MTDHGGPVGGPAPGAARAPLRDGPPCSRGRRLGRRSEAPEPRFPPEVTQRRVASVEPLLTATALGIAVDHLLTVGCPSMEAVEMGGQLICKNQPCTSPTYSIPPYVIDAGGEHSVAHTTRDKAKLTARVKRLRGQVEAIERGLENEVGCAEILQLVASVRGAINGLMGELIEAHIREHVIDPAREPDQAKAEGTRELIEVLRAYLK